MNEEMNLETMECVEAAADCVVQEGLGKKIIKKSLIGACVAAGITGIVILVRKNKGKLDDWMVRRLKKKGYTVYDANLLSDDDFEDQDCSDESTKND